MSQVAGQIVHVESNSYQTEVVQSHMPVLLACFQSESAARIGTADLLAVANKYSGQLKVCVASLDTMGAIADIIEIEGTPTFIIYERGLEVDRLLGRWDEFLLSDFVSQSLFADQTPPGAAGYTQ